MAVRQYPLLWSGVSIGLPLGFALGETLLWGWVVEGIGLGVLQWVLLIHILPRPGWFALSGGAGLVLGVGGGFLVASLVFQAWSLAPVFGAIGVLVGLSVGVTQWLALRQRAENSIWWIPSNILGYTSGLLAGTGGFPLWQIRHFRARIWRYHWLHRWGSHRHHPVVYSGPAGGDCPITRAALGRHRTRERSR